MIGIPKGFKKVAVREATSDIVDVQGWTLSKGQKFFVLEMKIKRPPGFPINIAIDNGFKDDKCYPLTSINEDDFDNLTRKEE